MDSWDNRSVVVDEKINKTLDYLNNAKIRKRRTLYAKVYNEAMISQSQERHLIHEMLLLLAHHKLIDDREVLV